MPDGAPTSSSNVPDSRGIPDVATRDAILALADLVESADGAPPLSDQALRFLTSADVTHRVVRAGTDSSPGAPVTGYAQRDRQALELVAEADAIDVLLDDVRPGDLVWSHGQHSRLVAVFEHRGYRRVRELFQLRRPATSGALPPDPPLADGVTVRPFVVGRDEQAWLAVNAAAFAEHPEQGRWTRADLIAREHESWFDPTGFLLAERAGELLGFHWTKVHPDGWGEVYVLGVAPTAQGLGLGNALLVRGLRHLDELGGPSGPSRSGVLLYVDGDNTNARRLYERLGFDTFDLDVQWRVGAS